MLLQITFCVLQFLHACVNTAASNPPTYFVFFPRHIRSGFPIQIVIEIFKNTNPVDTTAFLRSSDGKIDLFANDSVSEGQLKTISFRKQIPLGYDGSTEFELSVIGIDSVTNETIISNSTLELLYQTKSLSMFIQTDKGIYKPSQAIKFRGVVTTPDLLPYNGTISYKLIDPGSNVILQKKNATLNNGMAVSEFILGRYSTLGEWKITFECQGNTKIATVLVDEYQLPKFEIKFTPNQLFVDPDGSGYSGRISAKFTFGQPVKGVASILFKVSHYEISFFWNKEIKEKSFELKYPNFQGEAAFDVSVIDIKSRLGWNPENDYRKKMFVVVKVKDKNSQLELQENFRVELVRIPVKVKKISTPRTVKPGLFYTAYLHLTQFDDSRITEQQRRTFGMRIKYTYIYTTPKVYYHSGYQNVEIDEEGVVKLTMRANSSSFQEVSFQVDSEKYAGQYFLSWNSRRFESPSGTYIQLSTAESLVKPGQKAIIDVACSRRNETYSVTMVSRGIIVYRGMYVPGEYTADDGGISKFQYEFTAAKNMVPVVAVAFYFTTENGEIVADNVNINVEHNFENQISLSTNVSNAETGEAISMTVDTIPGATVALRAIDISVILQRDGNDINTDKVVHELAQYNTVKSYRNRNYYYDFYHQSSAGNARGVFQDTGLLVFTDAAVFVQQELYPDTFPEDMIEEDDEVEDNVVLYNDGTAESDEPDGQAAPQVRKNFPETWIWTEDIVGADGKMTYSYVLPDTTTTWEISAFSLSHSSGIGILEPDIQIVASRDFFISLTLPPTMIMGEVLSMRTTVYNFLETAVKGQLKLLSSDWYEIVMNGDDESVEGPVRDITVPSQDGKTEIFSIRFLKPGTAIIKVSAIADRASDAIERTLTIKPEGIERDISQNTLIERDANSTAETNVTFRVNIPVGVVDGSVYGRLSVSGNVLGNSWNNLGDLLRLPRGCGEQTMLSYAPDVFISHYLDKVGLLTGEVERKSTRHIVAGYQNELRYQHNDGGFSAFGHGSQASSTWLTAFVAKSFIAARELNSDFAHEEKIDPAVDFLLGAQRDDGSFEEKGVVWHKDMQGGVSNQETMTAYVMIALSEYGYKQDEEDIADAVAKATRYLEGKVDGIEEVYALSVITYALALSGSAAANRTFDRLVLRAKSSGNTKYWAGPESESCGNSDSCQYADASSSDIETTAYALLTYMTLGKASECMPIVRWIVRQRGSLGGYRSTQDTVMAIQALSVFAGLYSSGTRSLTITARHSADVDDSKVLSVTDDNMIVLQQVKLPPVSGDVTVTAEGLGLADVQLSYKYYLPLDNLDNEPFTVKHELVKINGLDKMRLRVCSSVNGDSETAINGTGMYVMAVTLPSGYLSDEQETAASNTDTELVEVVENEVAGYFNQLTPGEELCFTVNLNRFSKVGNVKPQMIRAFDYYKPEVMSYRMYAPQGSDNLCDTFEKDMHGCGDGSGAEVPRFVLTLLLVSVLVSCLL